MIDKWSIIAVVMTIGVTRLGAIRRASEFWIVFKVSSIKVIMGNPMSRLVILRSSKKCAPRFLILYSAPMSGYVASMPSAAIT